MLTLDMALQRWGEFKDRRTLFTLKPVSLMEKIPVLKSMSNSRAFGHNKIDPLSIKCATVSLHKPINFITNLSLSQHKFANKWRLARVIPIYKGNNKDKNNPDSFRPIALLPIISKVIEKHVQSQLNDHMTNTAQWNPNNHAYKSRHSTTTTLLEMTDKIFQACEDKEIAVALGVDQTAAFDSINFEIMYKKMHKYNFDTTTIKWMKLYLEHRTQYVTVGAHDSIMMPVESGVPQGSLLGPTMYVNEIPDIVNDYTNCNNNVHLPSESLFGLTVTTVESSPATRTIRPMSQQAETESKTNKRSQTC